ncbi:MAG: hypothetical protein ABIV11_01265 [Gemmatimonadaceae bacterium]
MSSDRSTAVLPLDEFERVKAIVTSYRLVDTPAIVAAREYGYDISLFKSSVAYSPIRRLNSAQPIFSSPGASRVRERPGGDAELHPPATRPNAPTVEMLRALASAQVRFIVIGGVAAQLLGSPRVTRDLDILYDIAADNLDCLADVLVRWHPYLRGVEPGLPFIPDSKTIKAVEVLNLDTDFGWFDILQRVAGIGAYADAIRAADSVVIGDFSVNVLSLEALIRSKLATGRPRDKIEVLELEALRDVAEQHRAALDGEARRS